MSDFVFTPFKWSKSRYELFALCRRRYYYNYYGARGGHKKDADPAVRNVWLLKNLAQLGMIKGALIHVWVAQTIKRFKAGSRPSLDWAVQTTMNRILEVIANSESVTLHENPEKHTRLFEHEYDVPITENTIHDLGMQVQKCFETLYGSKLLRYLAQNPDAIKIVEDNDTKDFFIRNVQCWAKLDLCYLDEEENWQIVDWKTGRSKGDESDLQARLYAYYIRKTENVPVEKIRARYLHLLVKEASTFGPYANKDMDALEEYVLERAREMTDCLTDPERELAEIENFPLTEETQTCVSCNFKRLCGR